MTDTPFDIYVAPGFEPVVDAFKANFTDGIEHAAGFSVVRDGEVIIDLKGGWADRKKTVPLSEDHLVAVFSSGKAVAALILATLADDDRFGYEQPMRTVWHGFDQHGKGDLTVAQALSHQSGLSGITDPDFTSEDWYDWDKACRTLAAQKPIYEPGSASGYHPLTYGFIAGQIARETDEFARPLGQILREDICDMHDLNIWLGMPEALHHRCPDILKPRALPDLGEINDATRAAFLSKNSTPARLPLERWRSADLAGSNCHATARSLALFMQMAVDGTVCGERYLAEDILEALRQPRISGPDLVLPYDLTMAAGVMCNSPNFFYGPNSNTVGHSGWGGSCVFADPDAGLSAAYVMTQQDNLLMGDPRPLKIIDALYRCV